MRASFFRSAVSTVLILTSTVSWCAPAWALRPAERGENKAGAEELRVAFASSGAPTQPALSQPVIAAPNSRTPLRATAGAEEWRVASLPITHEIDYHLPGRFLSGRVPSERSTVKLLKVGNIPHPQLATQWIGVISAFEQLVGAGRGLLDTIRKRAIVDRADLRAQEIQDEVARLRGIRLRHVNFETKGLTPGGLSAGAMGGTQKGKPTPTISDVVEHTTAFVEGEPGASSMQLEGLGAETFGSFPDEARGLMVATHIDPKLEMAVLKRNGAKNIDEFLDPELPADQLVRRVAELNGVLSSQVDVTILTNDESDMKALHALQEIYPELKVYQIKAGTVAPSIAAVLGVNDRRVRLFLRRSGMTEAVYMTILAGVFTADGSYSNFRVVSEEIKSEFARRYDWNQAVLGQMKVLRPNDWEEIRDGKKIFSSRQLTKPVVGAYTFLTNGRTDIGLPFQQVEGVRQGKGLSKVYALVFASNPRQAGAGFLWGSLDSYRIPSSTSAAGAEEKFTDYNAFLKDPKEGHNHHLNERTKASGKNNEKGFFPGSMIWHDLQDIRNILALMRRNAPHWAGKPKEADELRGLLQEALKRLLESYQAHYQKEHPSWAVQMVSGSDAPSLFEKKLKTSTGIRWVHSLALPLVPQDIQRLLDEQKISSMLVASNRNGPQEVVVFDAESHLLEGAHLAGINVPRDTELGRHLFSLGAEPNPASGRARGAYEAARIQEDLRQARPGSSGEIELPAAPVPLPSAPVKSPLEQTMEEELFYPSNRGPLTGTSGFFLFRQRWNRYPGREKILQESEIGLMEFLSHHFKMTPSTARQFLEGPEGERLRQGYAFGSRKMSRLLCRTSYRSFSLRRKGWPRS